MDRGAVRWLGAEQLLHRLDDASQPHGLAIQFAAVGGAFYEAARKAGAGRDLPTDWFTENVHP